MGRTAVFLALLAAFFAACSSIEPAVKIPHLPVQQPAAEIPELPVMQPSIEIPELTVQLPLPVDEVIEEIPPSAAAPVKPPGDLYVYLTFDDGPSPHTERILDVLAAHQVKGTFFFLGSEILEYEDPSALFKRVLDEGHYIGLHSMTHLDNRLYRVPGAYQNFYDEMRELQSLIYELTGGFQTNLYRAPFGTRGSFTNSHVRKMTASDLKCWDWNVDSEDWRHTSAGAVLAKIKNDMHYVYPKTAVVLFHERNVTVEVLPAVIEYFLELGYTFLSYNPDNHFSMNLLRHPGL